MMCGVADTREYLIGVARVAAVRALHPDIMGSVRDERSIIASGEFAQLQSRLKRRLPTWPQGVDVRDACRGERRDGGSD